MPISTIVGLLIYVVNAGAISCHCGLARVFVSLSFLVVLLVNNSLSGRCFFLALRLTIMSFNSNYN